MESIDALANAVNEFEGGLVLVSHDMRLISQVAKEIFICDNRTITKYKGDIMNFKMDMRHQMGIEETGGKLRGDASVKASADKAKKAAPKKADPKLEVVRPKAPATVTIAEEAPKTSPAPVSLPSSPHIAPVKDTSADDDATAVTTATGNSISTSTSGNSNGTDAAAAAPKRYIPPHLRKKMALEQQQQQQ
jgi:hypothetical protein